MGDSGKLGYQLYQGGAQENPAKRLGWKELVVAFHRGDSGTLSSAPPIIQSLLNPWKFLLGNWEITPRLSGMPLFSSLKQKPFVSWIQENPNFGSNGSHKNHTKLVPQRWIKEFIYLVAAEVLTDTGKSKFKTRQLSWTVTLFPTRNFAPKHHKKRFLIFWFPYFIVVKLLFLFVARSLIVIPVFIAFFLKYSKKSCSRHLISQMLIPS